MLEPLKSDGNADRPMVAQDFTSTGDIKDKSGDLALVVGSAEKSESFITTKAWSLLWRDAD